MKRILSVFTLLFVLIVSANAQDISSALRQADARFTSGNESGAIELVNKILAKYPSNKEAIALLDKFNTTIKKREIDADWKIATQTNTFEAYQQFRAKHPNSEYDCLASDNMAKRLADKFTPNSTYTERTQAESYAKKEMTKDYVKNKWNAAMAKKTSSSSASSSTSTSYRSSTSSTSSSYNSSYSSNRNYDSYSSGNSYSSSSKKEKKGTKCSLGLETSIEGSKSFTYGVGASLRLGRYDANINMTIGFKYQHTKYSDYLWYVNSYYDKYGRYDGYTHGNADYKRVASQFVCPIILNWNIVPNEFLNWYFGLGYEFGMLLSDREYYEDVDDFSMSEFKKSDNYDDWVELCVPSSAIVFQTGMSGRYWDWTMLYYKINTRSGSSYNGESGAIGTKLTVYF